MLEQLKIEAENIQKYLETTMSENGEEAVQRGSDLIVYLARTSKMLADAKDIYYKKIKSDLMKELIKQFEEVPVLSAKAINLIVESIAMDEKYMVNWIERLNATITHQIEWCRTVVSKAKQEAYNNRNFDSSRL